VLCHIMKGSDGRTDGHAVLVSASVADTRCLMDDHMVRTEGYLRIQPLVVQFRTACSGRLLLTAFHVHRFMKRVSLRCCNC